jgi:outer membrane biosynthesis protein TonB
LLQPDPSYSSRREPAAPWLLALLAALLTHALLLGAVEFLGIFEPSLPPEPSYEPLELVFTSPPVADETEPAENEEPTEFSELPEDRADLSPENPDFLSNVDSRARDRAEAEGEETELPRMEGRSEAPHVALSEAAGEESGGDQGALATTEDQPGGGEILESQPPANPVRSREGAALQEVLNPEALRRQGLTDERVGGSEGRPGSGDGNRLREAIRAEPRYSLRANGSDFFQEEMANPEGNISLFGDISLNTLAWEFAPWIQRFVREFHRNWFPPYAYAALGLTSGYQLVDLEVAPDGRLLQLVVLEEEGHEALKESTLTTFRAFAPYQPLPDDFPEPTLKLRVKVIYPTLRRPDRE